MKTTLPFILMLLLFFLFYFGLQRGQGLSEHVIIPPTAEEKKKKKEHCFLTRGRNKVLPDS